MGIAEGSQSALGDNTDRIRTRVRLLVELTSRSRAYRHGAVAAARQLSPEEAEIMADLESHGMQASQLHDVLCGGHVLIDDPELYEAWRFDKVSHTRISSHHRDIDKSRYPDIGMPGALVRAKLHGRTAHGTWVQLEKTPMALGRKKLPNLNDVRHLADYVIYRMTRSNVGPWGSSRRTERHPIYLSPILAVPITLRPEVEASLASALRRIEEDDDSTAIASDLARRFPPPERSEPARDLVRHAGSSGRGLFGNSGVLVTEMPSAVAVRILHEGVDRQELGWPWTDGVSA
jgi:hypothetical protein